MWNGLLERLRGARRIELFAVMVAAALLALALAGGSVGRGPAPKTELESRMERILARVDGAGRVSAMITQDDAGGVLGVLVVADGLRDVETYLRLQRAVTALLDIPPERVEILGGRLGIGGAQ